jgi:hypothetical protein
VKVDDAIPFLFCIWAIVVMYINLDSGFLCFSK